MGMKNNVCATQQQQDWAPVDRGTSQCASREVGATRTTVAYTQQGTTRAMKQRSWREYKKNSTISVYADPNALLPATELSRGKPKMDTYQTHPLRKRLSLSLSVPGAWAESLSLPSLGPPTRASRTVLVIHDGGMCRVRISNPPVQNKFPRRGGTPADEPQPPE